MISNQKRIWSEQQDQVLKKLYEQEAMRNWSLIAKKMSADYNLPRKSAKQCRQRYQNHLCLQTAKIQWTIEEEMMLIQYHNEIGNKWSLIAQKIAGKSDNCVKNHFYSKLRKVLRKLNMVIHSNFRRVFRQININTIYKIVQGCEQQFKEKPNCQANISALCREIQNKMLNLSMLKEEQFDSEERIAIYREVISQIYSVSKLYKRKSKKTRNNSIQAPNTKKKKKEVILVSNQMQGYASDSSSAFEGEDQESISQNSQLKNQNPLPITVQPSQLKVPNGKNKTEVIVQEQQQGIKSLLAGAGILHHQQSQANSAYGFKFSSRSSFKSYSEKNDSDQHFFEDSDLEKGFFPKSRKNSCFRNFASFSERSQGEEPKQFYFN